jgi:hypothetical protein
MPTVLSYRDLNRALLARQLLLRRDDRPVLDAVRLLFGMQAQLPAPPYTGLWNRLVDFDPERLSALLTDRSVVRIGLQRGTIHLVTADDALMLRPLLQPVHDRALAGSNGDKLDGIDVAAATAYGRQLLDAEPRTFAQLGELLQARFGGDAQAFGRAIRTWVPLVQVPPRGLWGRTGPAAHTSIEHWLGRPLDTDPSPDEMFLRYLAVYGPASVKDAQTWCGLTRLGEVAKRLRPRLLTFRDENNVELFDLPDAPRPGGDVPAPVRFMAEWDNVLLSHADRGRIIGDPHKKHVFTVNGVMPGTVLVDGFVGALWRITTAKGVATVTVTALDELSTRTRKEIEAEGLRLLAFAAAGAGRHEVVLA